MAMRVLLTGVCGFVGSTLAVALSRAGVEVVGADNFIRPGSELNRQRLAKLGVKVFHADLRSADDVAALPAAHAMIDCAANPSVLAGVDGSPSRGVFDHNLTSTLHLLEWCKRNSAAFVLLSTSRVYSIPPLARMPVVVTGGAFVPDSAGALPPGVTSRGVTSRGVTEDFSTAPPISLYGASKLASELVALEYGLTFGFPVWINRCGVLAGAGQFGRADQGIFAYWINAYLRRRPLKYIGFDGHGHQSRDALHPDDLVPVLLRQLRGEVTSDRRIFNLGGGAENLMSLRQLTAWCRERFGFDHPVASDPTPRPFDIPWMAMDASRAGADLGFAVGRRITSVLDEIADHAQAHPDWLDVSSPPAPPPPL